MCDQEALPRETPEQRQAIYRLAYRERYGVDLPTPTEGDT